MQKPSQRRIDELLDAYRGYLLSTVSKVRILGEADERELKAVFIELSIVDQRAPQRDAKFLGMIGSTMRRRLNPFADENRDVPPEPPKRRVKPRDLLQRRTKAIVTGAPGCGKTTLLKYLALQAQEGEKRLAVWLELKSIDKALFAEAERAAAHEGSLILPELWLMHLRALLSLSDGEIKLLRAHWKESLRAGEVAVFLDGFDELQGEAIECSLNKCVREFSSASHDNTLLISTRPYARHKLGKERLQELEIEPLDQRQIKAFLNCYYPNDEAAKSLLKGLRENLSLRELLHVPLLLGVVLRLYGEGRFADERLKLYETIITHLARQLDRSKSINRLFTLGDERLRLDFLKFLAFEQLLRDPPDEEEREAGRITFGYDLIREKAGVFLAQERLPHSSRDLADDALVTPLLREIGEDTFAFTHLTLQEYLAARAFAAFYKDNEFEGLKLFCHSYHNQTIVEMETLPMMLGALGDAERLYAEIERLPESLTFANLRLRARGLAYSARIHRDRLSNLIDRLLEFVSGKNLEERAYQKIVINSFAGVSRQAMSLVEAKAAPLIEDDPTDERGTIYWLARLGSHKALDAHIAGLRDEDSQVRLGAIIALETVGNEKALDAILETWRGENSFTRSAAAYSIGRIGSDKAVDALRAAWHDEDDGVRWSATQALASVASGNVVDVLLTALQDEEADVRWRAAYVLGEIRAGGAVDALTAALQDENGKVRVFAAESLAYAGSDKGIDILIAALKGERRTLYMRATFGLGRIGSDKAIDALIAALHHQDHDVCESAAYALARNGSDKAVGVLLAALHDGNSRIRSGVVDALGEVNSGKAVDAIIAALQDEDSFVRWRAAYVLSKSAPDRAVGPLVAVLKDVYDNVRWSAADTLGWIGSDRAVDALIENLQDEEHMVRMGAIMALGRIGSDRAVDALTKTLQQDESIIRRWRAAEALGRIGSGQGVNVLIMCLHDDMMAEHAAETLSQLKIEPLVEGLARTVERGDARARKKAVSVIGYYSKDERMLGHVRQLAQTDEDGEVRQAAKEAADKFARKLEVLGQVVAAGGATPLSDNESREGVLVGEVTRITFEAGHIFRPTPNNDWGIDGEIEFKNEYGEASGKRVYLQLKSGDSYLRTRKAEEKEIFTIKNSRHAVYWQAHAYPVLLVIRDSAGRIRWMNISEYLRQQRTGVRQIEFRGEPFTVESVKQMRTRFVR
jgi:HEAT repeat protein